MRHRPDRYIALAILTTALCAPSSASAQPGIGAPVTSWTLQRLLSGSQTPDASVVLPLSEVACNLDPTSTAPSGSARWDDPFIMLGNPIRACQWVDPGTGPIRTAVAGVPYQVRMNATANPTDGPSAWSALVDFRIPTPAPAAPTGVRVRPGQ